MCWVGALPCAAEELAIKVPLSSLLPRTRVREIGVKEGGETEPLIKGGGAMQTNTERQIIFHSLC